MSYKKLILKSTASIEIENTISHYSHINKSLAQKLEKEIRYSFLKISKHPESFQFRYQTIRIIWLKTFPYGIYYIFDSDEVYILAFWHTKEDAVNKLKK
ncbi:type II toxin-antitoxin system RelE/ParE family toxin [Flavobacterium azooxidireducens]|uniref:Type II toxin-antitoxin system RelE/ParE family toxin n=1 Tax=Flavobacterium azooxidireducens TaxID=1871076 RepID=A0ABY4KHX1_9FLAO|nr:type II toxin-antitoxin system RelE/ParE family toxin [Flavobacterium azooxidireducens]UPQ80418.1 type II toxin-antitoxin system RelE/ParE family toxin [Flavobacterium azooxidireducens]